MASLHAHRVFHSLRHRALGQDVPRSEVITSWERCVEEYHLEPHHVARPHVLTHTELKQIREPVAELIAVASNEMDRLFRRLADDGYIVLLTEAHGISIAARLPDTMRVDAHHARLIAGSVWREEHQGTNGVGTCLRIGQPVSIVQDEHFAVHNAPLTCTVAPIRAPSGETVAVLDVSTPKPTSHDRQRLIIDIVRNSARRIENRLFRHVHRRDTVLRLSRDVDFADCAEECLLALDATGGVIAADRAAHDLLAGKQAGGLIGCHIEKLLQLKHDDLLASLLEGPLALRALGVKHGCVYGQIVPGRAVPSRPPAAQARKPEAFPMPDQPVELDALAGRDRRVREFVNAARRAYAAGLPVLLTGETGTGKGVMAMALHKAGPRAEKPFITINCAAIPPTLIESELFGYRPGAFTGAAAKGSRGRLLAANGGTLFLDEIGDMPLDMQTRLLRALSERTVDQLGGQAVILDVAVIAATLQPLEQLVATHKFREDLYHRLAGAVVPLPALRDRSDLTMAILNIFAEECRQRGIAGDLSPELLALLIRHSWPGNFRELHFVARYAAAMSDGEPLSLRHLPARMTTAKAATEDRAVTSLAAALDRAHWNVSAAARELGLSRATIHRHIRAHGLHRP